jgi:hypothetical protein
MDPLNTWGAIAASFLLVQCIVFNLIFLGLAFGLWKGSSWLHSNTRSGLARATFYAQQGRGYMQLGLSYLAAPFVRLHGRLAAIRAMRARLRSNSRE